MERRDYGKTGESLSVVGFGGIVVMETSPSDADRIVGRAFDRGINYFDVAPSYGNAEERLGPALKPYRDEAFLACKSGDRSAEGIYRQMGESLKILRTDCFDLYQLHGVTSVDEAQQILGPGGAIEALVKAREEGHIRFIGFSAHSEEAALHLMDGFQFDSVLFPLNFASWFKAGFGRKVVEAAEKKGLAILALKALALRRYAEGEERKHPKGWYCPVDSFEQASLALRFTLSLPVTAAVSASNEEHLWWALDIADRLTPLDPEEDDRLRELADSIEAPVFE